MPLSAHTSASPPLRPAATVLLLRDDGGDVQAFLIRRSGGAGFMAGATVFPGGKVDPADALLGPWPALVQATAAQTNRTAESVAAALGAAARELCEEAGVVLARPRAASGAAAAADGPHALDSATQIARAVAARRVGHRIPAEAFAQALIDADAEANFAALRPFAWWVTPEVEPLRFDTLFFVATLPPGQSADADGEEGSEGAWWSPEAALAAHAGPSALVLPPPTLHTLARAAAWLALRRGLGRSVSARGLADALAAVGVGPCWQPHFTIAANGAPLLLLPGDEAHPTEAETGRRDRFALRDGRFVYDRSERFVFPPG